MKQRTLEAVPRLSAMGTGASRTGCSYSLMQYTIKGVTKMVLHQPQCSPQGLRQRRNATLRKKPLLSSKDTSLSISWNQYLYVKALSSRQKQLENEATE